MTGGNLGCSGCDQVTLGIQQQDNVRSDASRVVSGCRKDRGFVATRHGLSKTEIGSQYADSGRQLVGTETHELLHKGAAGAQLLCSARFDVMRRAGEHCGQRHSLSDDDQPDDQHEKPFAETTHEPRLNPSDIVGIPGRSPREFERRNETLRTSIPESGSDGLNPAPRIGVFGVYR